MLIPVGESHVATLTGSTWRAVTCQKCACQFAYWVSYEATGEETAALWLGRERAARVALEQAHRKLPTELARARGFLPCPKCGHFQSDMLRAQLARAAKDAGVLLLGFLLILVLGAGLVRAVTGSEDLGALLGLGAAVGLLVPRVRELAASLSKPADWHPGKAFSEAYPVLLRAEYESALSSRDPREPPLPQLRWPSLRTIA